MSSRCLSLLAAAAALIQVAADDREECAIAGESSECREKVMDALLHGSSGNSATFAALQTQFWKAGEHGCPRPCQPQEEACEAFGSSSPCYNDVKWAEEVGLESHPGWYPGLSQGASSAEVAKFLYTHGQWKCARPCDEDEEPGHFVPFSQSSAASNTTSTSENPEDKEIARLAKILMKQGKPTEPPEQHEEEVDECAKSGITYNDLDMHDAPLTIVTGVTACHMHCKGVDGAGYFLFHHLLKWCHCVQVEEGKRVEESSADNNYVGGSVECPKVSWDKVNKATGEIVKRLNDNCFHVDKSYPPVIGELPPMYVDTSMECQKKLQSSDDESAAYFSFVPSTGACRIIPTGTTEITLSGAVSGPKHCSDDMMESVVRKFDSNPVSADAIHKGKVAAGLLVIAAFSSIAAVAWRWQVRRSKPKAFSSFPDQDAEQGLQDTSESLVE